MLKTFYVGIKGIVVSDNKALILKRKDENGGFYWDIPGGRIDDNENIEETLRRELHEELGITNVDKFDLIHSYRLPKDLKDGQGLLLVFFKVSAAFSKITLSEEHEEYKWVSKKDLEIMSEDKKAYMMDGYKEAIKLALS